MIQRLPIGMLGSNCYLVYDGGEGAIVDPGMQDPAPLIAVVRQHGLRIRYVLNTHGHFDHVAGNSKLLRSDEPALQGARLGIHPDDEHLLLTGGGAGTFGIPYVPSPEPELMLEAETTLTIGALTLRVIATPGHTPGSICLYSESENALITGDTLFAGNVGRTDLPGGDARALTRSLKRIQSLPPVTRILPGHGEASTLERENRRNPWMRRPGT